MTTCEEGNRELLDDFFLSDDDFAELIFEFLVGFPQLIDGFDVVFRKGCAGAGRGLTGC